MTDWLERLLKQAAEDSPDGDPAAPALEQALTERDPLSAKVVSRRRIEPEGVEAAASVAGEAGSFSAGRSEAALTAGELAAGLLREELRLGTPTAPAAAEGENWLAEPVPSPIRESSSPLPALLTSPDILQIDRAFERDARRFDGTFSLY